MDLHSKSKKSSFMNYIYNKQIHKKKGFGTAFGAIQNPLEISDNIDTSPLILLPVLPGRFSLYIGTALFIEEGLQDTSPTWNTPSVN
jgi:hypothetical protein